MYVMCVMLVISVSQKENKIPVAQQVRLGQEREKAKEPKDCGWAVLYYYFSLCVVLFFIHMILAHIICRSQLAYRILYIAYVTGDVNYTIYCIAFLLTS